MSNFVLTGLLAGESVVTIATKKLREGIAGHIRPAFPRAGHDRESLPNYTALDADEVLSSFLVGASPQQRRFDETMDRLFGKIALPGKPIRVYGEMVVRLWENGSPDAALELEHFWNLLSHRYAFSLLCAYPMTLFRSEERERFIHTCALHDRVAIPTT